MVKFQGMLRSGRGMGPYAKRENLYLTQYFEFPWFKSLRKERPLCKWIQKSEVGKPPDRPAIGQVKGNDKSKLGQEDDVEAASTKFGN